MPTAKIEMATAQCAAALAQWKRIMGDEVPVKYKKQHPKWSAKKGGSK